MISWRGYGLIGLMFPLVAVLLAALLTGGVSSVHFKSVFLVLLLLAAVANWFVGRHLNGDLDAYDAPHVFMGCRLQFAGVIYVAIAALTLWSLRH